MLDGSKSIHTVNTVKQDYLSCAEAEVEGQCQCKTPGADPGAQAHLRPPQGTGQAMGAGWYFCLQTVAKHC